MKKMIVVVLILFCGVCYSVTPKPEEHRGLKRYVNEIMPLRVPTLTDVLIAAQRGTPAQLMHLLESGGVDVNVTDHQKNTLLMYAAENGNLPTLNALIEHGADINLQNIHKNTALHFAVKKNHLPVVTRLLEKADLNLNATNSKGNTPLMLSILYKNSPVTALLLRPEIVARGLDINKPNNYGGYPLIMAIDYHNLPLLDRLLLLGAKTSVGEGLEIPLHTAVIEKRPDLIQRLLDVPGIAVNQADGLGETALMIAAYEGNLAIARMLLNAGALVNLRDAQGKTALDYAKKSENKNKMMMIKLLRDSGRLQ